MKKLLLETDYFALFSLAEGVYAAVAKPGQGAWSNAGFIDLGDEVLVFDAFSTPAAARELRAQAEKLTGKPIKYLFNSHYHGDHTFGNQVFADTTIFSTSLTRQWHEQKNVFTDLEQEKAEMNAYLEHLKEQIASAESPILKTSLIKQYEEMEKVTANLSELKIVLPTLVFEKHLIIHGSSRSVEFFCFGGGHTVSDAFLYLPNEKIAFMGDIYTENMHLPIYNPEEFMSILKKVGEMDIEIAVPGHGEIGTKALGDTMLEYLTLLTFEAKQATLENVSEEAFIASFEVPDEYTNWQGVDGISRNLKTVYQFYKELRE